ncbi:MAG: YaaR family protein [Syntrophomonadaceae bacterium]|nr:YaaR family protein [Syntrophomonadaceae bacterium]
MRIERNRKTSRDFNLPSNTGIRGVQPASKGEFSQELLDKEQDFYQMRMQELLLKIDGISEKLSKNLNINDLIQYKQLVQSFLKEATASAYLVKEQRSFTRRGARSVLISIETINREVEEVLHGFITKRKEPMEVLAALDKIRGMMVDLLA